MSVSDDVAIIGAGQSAKYVLLALAHAIVSGRLPAGLRISIYEQGRHWGTGLAWSPDVVGDMHLSSLAAPSVRAQVGREEWGRFERIVAFLRSLGAQVTARLHTTIKAIEPAAGGWSVQGEHVGLPGARHVVLAIGHSAFAEKKPLDGVFQCPWPFNRLRDLVDARIAEGGGRVLILGSYLTAVDVAVGLGAIENQGMLHLSVLSSSGELPKVWGSAPPPIDVDALCKTVLGQPIAQCRAEGRLDLAAVEQMILFAAFGEKEDTCGSLAEKLQRLCAGKPAQRLKEDLRETADGAVLAWQTGLFGGLPVLSEAFPRFSDRDKLRFLSQRSRYYRAAMPMARENALRLDALFEAGSLDILAAPQGYRLCEDRQRNVQRLDVLDDAGIFRTVGEFDLVVAAAGPDVRLDRTVSPVLRHLYDRGLACAVYAQDAGETIELGGVKVNPCTCEMVPADVAAAPGEGSLFAIGPLLIGTFPDAQSVGHIARDAERIVERLVALTARD
ncbi:FAD/NAD(P)-binding protein [Pseudomonas mosselii]|uniref:FAD/NAD(P)-binding protein n=1 Tax=Pseudomonas mosselii TaxID=78327 RepID=UPI000D919BC7|nr:hypothetical protein [Pseudomonas mosselii]PYC16930.1 hypothetical protein DMX06_19210 [Pseudomonas mosselii]